MNESAIAAYAVEGRNGEGDDGRAEKRKSGSEIVTKELGQL